MEDVAPSLFLALSPIPTSMDGNHLDHRCSRDHPAVSGGRCSSSLVGWDWQREEGIQEGPSSGADDQELEEEGGTQTQWRGRNTATEAAIVVGVILGDCLSFDGSATGIDEIPAFPPDNAAATLPPHLRPANTAARLPPPSRPNNAAMRALRCPHPDNATAHHTATAAAALPPRRRHSPPPRTCQRHLKNTTQTTPLHAHCRSPALWPRGHRAP
jgi:hypothetical protein